MSKNHSLLNLSKTSNKSFPEITLSTSVMPLCSTNLKKASLVYPLFFKETIVGSFSSSSPENTPSFIFSVIFLFERTK